MATRAMPSGPRAAELSDQAWSDYNDVLGTIIERERVYVLNADAGDDELHAPANQPLRLRVVDTPEPEVIRWMDDEHLDPTWHVVPADDEDRLDADDFEYWVFGPEYSLTPTKES